MSEPLTKHTGHLVEGLEWTEEKPTAPGWYWYQLAYQEIVEVFEVVASRHSMRVRFGDGSVRSIASCSGEWSGPIPPPTDAPAQD